MQMSVWKLAQSDLAGCRAHFLIVCGQCSTQSKTLPDPNNFGAKRSIQWFVKALLLQKQAQFDTVSKKAFNLPLFPCLNTASSPAQKILLLCIDFSRNGVLKQSTKGVEILNKSLSCWRLRFQITLQWR